MTNPEINRVHVTLDSDKVETMPDELVVTVGNTTQVFTLASHADWALYRASAALQAKTAAEKELAELKKQPARSSARRPYR